MTVVAETVIVEEWDMQEQAPEGFFVREAMGRVTDDLAEPPGLAAGAVREGRRRRWRSRLAVGGAALGTAALAAAGLAAVPGTGGSGGGGVGGAGVLQPAGPGDRVFPTVRMTTIPPPEPTGTRAPTGPAGSPSPSPDAEQLRWIETYRQATAGALQDLLPPEIGAISVVADGVYSYLGRSANGEYPLVFSVRPHSEGAPQRNCPQEGQPSKYGECRTVRLVDGASATVRVSPSDGGLDSTEAFFRLEHSDVQVMVISDVPRRRSSPVTVDQLIAFLNAPRVQELLHQADLHPVDSAQEIHYEGGNP
ncbi:MULTISPECIES: hypothetical protein [Kitasatospora]|uniref:hypothetical protein n=1 Tax=Kitasatospora TaxID=2063 RepID=UPI0011D21822|nr:MULTISPECIES: hypothetical protein [Kitasatospora]